MTPQSPQTLRIVSIADTLWGGFGNDKLNLACWELLPDWTLNSGNSYKRPERSLQIPADPNYGNRQQSSDRARGLLAGLVCASKILLVRHSFDKQRPHSRHATHVSSR
jgi:hypothetical protein